MQCGIVAGHDPQLSEPHITTSTSTGQRSKVFLDRIGESGAVFSAFLWIGPWSRHRQPRCAPGQRRARYRDHRLALAGSGCAATASRQVDGATRA